MRTILLFSLLLASLAILSVAKENSTRNATRAVRTKALRKAKKTKKSSKSADISKSESYHFPIVLNPSEGGGHYDHHEALPVSLELHDGQVPESPDMHPIEPIHLYPVEDSHLHHNKPLYVESVKPIYSTRGQHHHYGEALQEVAPPLHDYEHHGAVHHDYHKVPEVVPDYQPEAYGDLSAIPGTPGVDYPNYSELPHTRFQCLEHTSTPGFYADMETRCQVWHYCQPDGRHDRFLCPNGTVFDQMTRVCNWWYNVHCESSPSNYDVNFDLYHEPARIVSHPQTVEVIDTDSHHQVEPHYETVVYQEPSKIDSAVGIHTNSHHEGEPHYETVSYLEPSSAGAIHTNSHHQGEPHYETLAYHEPSRHDAGSQHHHQIAPSHYESSALEVPHANSFLRHVKDFEAHRGVGHLGSSIYEPHHSVQSAAASPQILRYPHKTAPSVVSKPDELQRSAAAVSGPVEYEASNNDLPPGKMARKSGDPKRKGKRRRYHRRNMRKNAVRVHPKEGVDGLPVYREGKVIPGRRLRIVKRKRMHKA